MGDGIREALEKAYDNGVIERPEEAPEQVEAAPEAEAEVEAPVEAAPAEETQAEKAQRLRDEAGRFTKAPEAAKPIKTPSPKPATASATPVPKPQGASVTPQPPAPTASTTKAPQSWKPQAREKWASLPPEVQQEAIRRETETARALQESAEARKSWDAFRQAVAPYEGMIRAEGGEPLRAVQDLLQTAHALRTAPVGHKAQMMAQMMNTFGVPVEALAQALDGRAPTQPQPQHFDPSQIVAQVREQVMRDVQAQQQQAVYQRNAAEVETFGAQSEFFDDVRDLMANLMEGAARSGLPLTLEEAYTQATRLHPEVSKVLSQRDAAQQANALQASTQRAKRAASSLRSHPAAPLVTEERPKDLRAALEAAWDNSGR